MAGSPMFPSTEIVQSNENGFFCLYEDTEVLTINGYINISNLKKNDIIITSDNRNVYIKKINKSSLPAIDDFFPYLIPKNFFYDNYPPNDTRISSGHKILINNKWLVPMWSGGRLQQDKTIKNKINYYHIELENYETDHLVINGGLIVESLGNQTFYKDRDLEICKKRELPENTYQFSS